ncbi:MAG: D-hexose-6-phosphate mutarotase [Planctomycetaceae bacterium]|nr:D-hexose-6-phosphate mutarotase [Planctomycetaceae bacterium]
MDFPVRPGVNGLEKIVVNTPVAQGEVYLQGAHVTAWQPTGRKPVLWMSGQSYFEPGKPIRGGMPVCFPWFGPHPADSSRPAHGTARIQKWSPVRSRWYPNGVAELVFEAHVAPFTVQLQIRMGQQLELCMRTTLSPEQTQPVSFEQALHTYFCVSDVRNAEIRGLENSSFIDKMRQARRCDPAGCPITFNKETDRVYFNTADTVVIHDSGDGRQIVIEKTGSLSTVVWNPWIDKSRRMPDFGDSEWPGMVCVETANVADNRVRLAPGSSHEMTVRISVKDR